MGYRFLLFLFHCVLFVELFVCLRPSSSATHVFYSPPKSESGAKFWASSSADQTEMTARLSVPPEEQTTKTPKS